MCASYRIPGDGDVAGVDQCCRRPGEWNREGCWVHSRVDLVVFNDCQVAIVERLFSSRLARSPLKGLQMGSARI